MLTITQKTIHTTHKNTLRIAYTLHKNTHYTCIAHTLRINSFKFNLVYHLTNKSMELNCNSFKFGSVKSNSVYRTDPKEFYSSKIYFLDCFISFRKGYKMPQFSQPFYNKESCYVINFRYICVAEFLDDGLI